MKWNRNHTVGMFANMKLIAARLRRNGQWQSVGRSKIGMLCLIVAFVVVSSSAKAQIETTFTEPSVSSELAFAESGIVQKVHVKPGDYIAKGNVVAELRSGVLQRALASAKAKANSKARINAAKAKLRLSAQKQESLNKLDRNGFANRQEVLRATTEYEQAKAEVQLALDENEIAKLEMKQIEAQLERRMIRSPFDGHIIEVHKEVGEYVSGSEPQFATLVVLKDLRARFYLIDRQASDLAVEDTVQLEIGERRAEGTVVFVSPLIDPDSRTLRVEVAIGNEDRDYISGESCRWAGKLQGKSTQTKPVAMER